MWVNTYETNGPGSNLRLTNFVQIYLYVLKVENYQVIARYYDSNMVLYSSVPRWVTKNKTARRQEDTRHFYM